MPNFFCEVALTSSVVPIRFVAPLNHKLLSVHACVVSGAKSEHGCQSKNSA